MEITAKLKDDTLRDILGGSMGCDDYVRSILESSGYISVIRTNMASICQITPKGKAFIAEGGYTAIEQRKEYQFKKEEAIKEKERQARMIEIEVQRIISERLMEKEHEFQLIQNKANRRNSLLAAFISAIISCAVTLLMQSL